mgnify:FL=1
MINRIFNWTAGSFFRTLGRFIFYGIIVFLLSLLFSSCYVKASSIPVYVNDLSYNNWSLLNGGWNSFSMGNRNINFGYSLDSSLTDRWVYNSLVLCSDSTFSGGYPGSGYDDYIRNISYNHTNYTCSYSNSSYSGGKVVIVNFQTYIGSESGGSFDGYFTVYQDVNVSLQLIDFVVNSNNYVSADNYSSQSLINQNSQIINQNNTIINQNQETNDKLDQTNEELGEMNDYIQDDTPASTDDIDMDSLGTVSGLLPEGPVDSLLNIPFTFLSVLTSSMGGVCVPITGTFVFDSTLSIPCFDSFYDDVPDYLMNFINLIPSGFILIMYFKHLYKKVERAVSLQTTADDEWGVI